MLGSITYPGDKFFEPVTKDTLYDIASLTKVVAATSCVMKLYEQGLLSLDDQFIKYVPEANNNGKDKILIRNLMLHNAGLAPDYPFDGSYDGVDRVKILKWLYNTTLDYPVGTKMVYSDNSMLAIQLVVERITKKSLQVFAQE